MPVRPVYDTAGKQRREKGLLVWDIDVYANGLRSRKRFFGTKTQAYREESKLYRQTLQKVGVHDQKKQDPTIEEFLPDYFSAKSKLKSLDTVRHRFKHILKFLRETGRSQKKLTDFTSSDVRAYIAWRAEQIPANTKKPVSDVTIKREVIQLKGLFTFAVRSDDYLLVYNCTDSVELVKEAPQYNEGLSIEQYHKLVDSAVDYLKPLLVFAGSTGWRKSEMLQLRLRRVVVHDFGAYAELEDSKNSEARRTTLPPNVIDALRSVENWGKCELCNKLASHEDEQCLYVFTRYGKPLRDIRTSLKRAYRDAGLEHIYDSMKPLHRFRNFYRTNHAEIGTDYGVIMREGGWKDARTFHRYLDNRMKARQETANKYAEFLEKNRDSNIVHLAKSRATDEIYCQQIVNERIWPPQESSPKFFEINNLPGW
ncbi:tyrosine-type recombinase/integrase [candidate division KSB1 bacterium]|nr:tyrosine-type recombinase/integrase [candidate division KSB1 bacterium]NIR68708.1 tyrosine-type recombinase/integrase [candidate division KSB1 bacterium]NIS25525.1 tyrosine-type recombinase/integrase [candidate division KSB1 bacterium]NIT72418.1 tyrosine-type recombinase/integrase [candidate division KSB1 bacterium]NIU26202.1 tyrosine-type recombinase/integrase [candidate division KSB1 bacterium]